jgi:hypothetical protein
MNRYSFLCVLSTLAVAAACADIPKASPYAGQEVRSIKALSEKEVTDLLEGAGMGYAKSAELNRYPGPSHALDLSTSLGLSDSQRSAIEEILRSHKAEARKLGGDVVQLERQLDDLFARGAASAEAIDAITARLASTSGALRASHLNAHVRTTQVLSAKQVDRYVELRGYGSHPH